MMRSVFVSLFLLLGAAAQAAPSAVVLTKAGVTRRFRVGAQLGKDGAGGAVFVAEDDHTGEKLAVKIPHDGALHKRLVIKEASVLRKLDGNPRFPRFHGLGHVEGNAQHPVLLMELVAGKPLESTAATRANPSKAVRIAIRELDGVQALNALDLRHGDLRTANVLVDDGQSESTKLLDLGAVGRLSTRYKWGGPDYYAPEQTARAPSLGRANGDVYSIGKHLLEMVTGLPPRSANLPHVANASLRAVIARAIDADPATRYRDAVELKAALRAFESHVP